MAEQMVLEQTTTLPDKWRSIASVALRGLYKTYLAGSDALPYTRKWNSKTATIAGQSIRYALISLIGLSKGENVTGIQLELIDALWQRISNAGGISAMNTGDLGLALWATALHKTELPSLNANHALKTYQQNPRRCDSVDLAWLLSGADHLLLNDSNNASADQLAQKVKSHLLSLFNPKTSLFYRHSREGLLTNVSRRIPCFANQIYPVMSLAIHARRTGCAESKNAAAAVADKVCQEQGEMGQWWWLYDAKTGMVMDGYPVYSVHQDGMAPMALMEASLTIHQSYDEFIEHGLGWTYGQNELNTSMVLDQEGLILRDIHKKGYGRMRRMIAGTLWNWGMKRKGFRTHQYEINPECRPYHPGWVLYAAGIKEEVGRNTSV